MAIPQCPRCENYMFPDTLDNDGKSFTCISCSRHFKLVRRKWVTVVKPAPPIPKHGRSRRTDRAGAP